MTTLEGTRVVVTRSAEDADTLAVSLEEIGAEVIRLPTIAIEYPDELLDAAADAVERLRSKAFSWIVFSSRPGVVSLGRALERHGLAALDAFEDMKVAVVGSATAAAFEALTGRMPDLLPDAFTGEDLAAALGPGSGSVLLPRPAAAPRSVLEELAAKGWDPVELPLYQTVRGEPEPEVVDIVRTGAFDVLTFTSGSTVRFYVEIVGAPQLDDKLVAVIGPSTEKVAREMGFRVDAVAEPHTTEGLVAAIATLVGP